MALNRCHFSFVPVSVSLYRIRANFPDHTGPAAATALSLRQHMMSLDRTKAPDFQLTDRISLVQAAPYRLDNGVPLYLIRAGEQPVVRVEWVFETGGWDELLPNVSWFTLRLLNEGTRQRKAAELAEFFDQYGAFLEFQPTADRSTVTLYALRKHLPVLLPAVHEFLNDAIFPEEELETQRTIALQNLEVNEGKTSFLAGRAFREQLFGADHPYGKSQTRENLRGFGREDLVSYFNTRIAGNPFRLFVAGLVDETEVSLLNRYFGQSALSPAPDRRSYADPHLGDLQSILLRVEDKMQSSIRIGKRMVNRLHPDYYPVLVTNEILGGYFGSRLMKNIREDKGYTYGIYSQINHFSHASQLVIGTDVNKEVTRQTLDEIRKEILRLQTEPVPAEELQTAKNYMTGQFVGSLNTPFEIADRHKVRILNQLPDDYSLRFIERIQAVTAEQVLEAAQVWFQWETLVEVVAGDK